jgi:hypothetical protein
MQREKISGVPSLSGVPRGAVRRSDQERDRGPGPEKGRYSHQEKLPGPEEEPEIGEGCDMVVGGAKTAARGSRPITFSEFQGSRCLIQRTLLPEARSLVIMYCSRRVKNIT